MRKTLPVLLVTSIALLATACSTATSTSPSAAAPAATSGPAASQAAASPAAGATAGGGSLSFAVEGDLQTLDPAICYDTNCGPVVHLLFDSLIAYDPNAATLRPGLAAAMPEVSADGLTYTFTLRDNATFTKQDGSVLRPVTADDVVYSLNRILDPTLTPTPSPVGPAFFAQIAGADKVLDGSSTSASGLKAVDAKTVAITITAPNRSFLNVLAMNFGSIVPKELAGADTTAFSAAPVGSGPFYLASYAKGDKAVLQRNPAYWREGYPRVDTVEYRLGVDANTQLQQVQAGQLDIMGNDIPAGAFTATTTDPALKDQVVREPLVATNFLIIDTSGPDKALADVRVRHAIAMAVDKDNILRVNNGRGTKAGCIFPPQMTAYDVACDPYPHDVAKAKALMADAGFADGFETSIYTDTQDISKAIAESIVQDLSEIGIKVDIVQQDFDVLIGTITTPHAAPLVYLGWFQDFPDASDFYDPIFSCAANVPGGASYGWYCNKDADALAATARANQDAAARDGQYRDLQDMVMADVPSVPLFFPDTVVLVSPRVIGNPFHPAYFIDLAEVDVSD
jgi:peptide/nickel transport system substrate-binding protein/oligopeptide transport system substrate-binding protein